MSTPPGNAVGGAFLNTHCNGASNTPLGWSNNGEFLPARPCRDPQWWLVCSAGISMALKNR